MQTKQYPFYIKSTVTLFGILLFVCFLAFLKEILVPLAFAGILAILLNPMFSMLQRWKVPRVPAIMLTLLIAFIVLGAILFFLSAQLSTFGDTLPLLKQKFHAIVLQVEHWLYNNYGITIERQVELFNEALNNSRALLGQTVTTAIGMVGIIFLLPVYIFLFLFYKPLILNFLFEVFAEENSKKVSEILNQTKASIQSYMVGLLTEALIVGILNSTALLILGVKYAILLGLIGAILNMLPYIGGIVAIILPLLMATVTMDGYHTQLGIIVAYLFIQFIDNHILVPRIVASKVQINALISIVAVLLGGALWGVPGMFLSIPFVAILKIIFDRIDDLKPWGKLLGDEVPTRHKGQIWNRFRKPADPGKVVSNS